MEYYLFEFDITNTQGVNITEDSNVDLELL